MTLLGIDLGTTSVKAAVFRPDGSRVAFVRPVGGFNQVFSVSVGP